jgi:hypothetical protein
MRLNDSFLFSLFCPVEKARLARAERMIGRLADVAGYDEWSDPLLAGIQDEVTAGHEIKATQMYCLATGAGIVEARLAVDSLRKKLAVT